MDWIPIADHCLKLFVDLEMPVFLANWAGASSYVGAGPSALRASRENLGALLELRRQETDQDWQFYLRDGDGNTHRRYPSAIQ